MGSEQMGPAEEELKVTELQTILAEIGALDSKLKELEAGLDIQRGRLPEGHPNLEKLESEREELKRALDDKRRLLRSIEEEGPSRQIIGGR